jgi:hypothetical protein
LAIGGAVAANGRLHCPLGIVVDSLSPEERARSTAPACNPVISRRRIGGTAAARERFVMFSIDRQWTRVARTAWAVWAWWFLDQSGSRSTSPRKGDVGRFGHST